MKSFSGKNETYHMLFTAIFRPRNSQETIKIVQNFIPYFSQIWAFFFKVHLEVFFWDEQNLSHVVYRYSKA